MAPRWDTGGSKIRGEWEAKNLVFMLKMNLEKVYDIVNRSYLDAVLEFKSSGYKSSRLMWGCIST